MRRQKGMMLFAKFPLGLLAASGLASVLLASCNSGVGNPNSPDISSSSEYEIVTLLPKDAIRAIDDPQFYSGEVADLEYEDDELVIGVLFDGEARAYSIDLLSSREIVNDTVRGHPIAVTW